MPEEIDGFEQKFANYLRASYPCLWIRSHEENRVMRAIYAGIKSAEVHGMVLYQWDSVNLLEKYTVNSRGQVINEKVNGEPSDHQLANIIQTIGKHNGRGVFVFKDFHSYIEHPGILRQLRNIIDSLRSVGKMIVFLSPLLKIPVEIEKGVQILDYALPTEEQLNNILESVRTVYNKSCKQVDKMLPEIQDDARFAAIEAAKGLTYDEAGDTFALAVMENREFGNKFIRTVFDEKVKQVKRHGLLLYIKPDVTFDDIGGLKAIKDWIHSRSKAYSTQAKAYGLAYPKGILAAGVSGTGKSTVAKAIASALGYPLFQLDIGSLFGSFVGQTEENLRRVTQTLDAMGRCVLWIDEIEKSLNRQAVQGSGDSGTSSRAFATFLTWLSEHKTPVFVVATCNDYTRLPLEFTRKGRFDEINTRKVSLA